MSGGDAPVRWSRLRAWVRPGVQVVAPFRPLRLLVATLRTFRRHHCGPRTAEIAYYAFLSAIPFGVLLLTAIGYVADHEEVTGTAWEITRALVPGVEAGLEEAIASLVRDWNTLGVVGIAALLLTASLVFGALNRSVAAIFDIRRRRRMVTMITFVAFLSALAAAVTLGIDGVLDVLDAEQAGEPGATAEALRSHSSWVRVLADLGIGLVFMLMLASAVRRAVGPRHMLEGALLFVALFELARVLFTSYLGGLSSLNLVYGSLSGLIAGILWVYYVSLTLLLAMCFVRVRQGRLEQGELGEILPT